MGDASTSDATALVSSGKATAATSAAEDRREEVVLLHHEGNGNGNGNGSGGGSLSANNSAEEDDKAGGNVEDGGDRSNNSAGNRWPRPETLALLQIRSDMDAAFRDSSLKAPLWEEVSRKLAELGYKRSAKKCKEKFENVYKYHKRTKDGRTGKPDRSKTYRFFDQLEAFEQNHHPPPPPPPPPQKPHQIMTSVSHNTFFPPNPTITNITPLPPPNNPLPIPQTIITNTTTTTNKSRDDNNNNSNGVPLSSPTSSSSTASDEEFQARHKRKRKWRHFFRRLTREVIRKQEEMQKRFLETVGKCEEERTAREEAWRLQEMARINREHEILLQERSAATAKDAAVISLLQKVSAGVTTGHNLATSVDNIFSSVRDKNINFNPEPSAPAPAPAPPPPPPPPAAAVPVNAENTYAAPPPSLRNLSTTSSNSSSRWPKAEVEALISLRRNLDLKYQEKVPKGPLWEEISAGMRRLGYDRSSKRCKEKWENINKYFKKLKDSNKKRSGDSKTCPYFQKLAEIYGEGSKSVGMSEKVVPQLQPPPPLQRFGMEPLMVQPERQWPVQQDRNDMVLEEEEEEEEEYEGDEEDHRDTSSTTEMEEDHDDHQQGTDIRSSVDMVE